MSSLVSVNQLLYKTSGVILIFAEALGLYGLIVGLVVASTAEGKGKNLCSSYA